MNDKKPSDPTTTPAPVTKPKRPYWGRRSRCRKCGDNMFMSSGGSRDYCQLCLNDFAKWGQKDD